MMEYVGPSTPVAARTTATEQFKQDLECLLKHTRAMRVTLEYTYANHLMAIKFYSFDGETIASLEVPYMVSDGQAKYSLSALGGRYRFKWEEPAGDELAVVRYVPLYA